MRTSLAPLALGAVVTLLAGCGARWTVVRQANPNPMTPDAPFFLTPPSLEGLRVGEKTEGEWMSEKDAETREKWEGDKAAMASVLVEGFDKGKGDEINRTQDPRAAFTIRTHFDHYEPGFYAGVVSGNGSIDATVDIFAPNGAPLDEFKVHAEAGGFSAGERARTCARQIGWTAGKYLRNRMGL
jgi:hypothetical protein